MRQIEVFAKVGQPVPKCTMQLSKKGMTLFVTLDASQLTDMTMVTVTLVTSSQADLYNTVVLYLSVGTMSIYSNIG